MSIGGINIYHVKSIDDYWTMLEKSLEYTLPHFLSRKHEYGTSIMCSEYGIQLSLLYSAERIAEKQKINLHKTRCICMATGLCFPEFGSYGMLAVEKYVTDHNIPLGKSELKIGAIETHISCSSIVTPQLDEALYAYYENSIAIPEVNVARYCQLKAKELRSMMNNGLSANESFQTVMKSAEESFSSEQSVLPDDIVDVDIPIEVQEKVYKSIEEFIEWDGMPQGIFRYITA